MNKLIFRGRDGVKAVAWLASYVDTLNKDKQYIVTVTEKRERRSLDANAYAWVLLDKLAAKLNIGKTELYRQYIKEIGGVSDTVCVRDNAVDKLCEAWEAHGIGWQTDRYASKLPRCVNVILYYGSSMYDKAQMSRLIDMIVQDCKEFGVETYSREEMDKLIENWV